MHQIRFRLGLLPRPRWGSLQRSPDPLARFKGSYLYGKGREGRGKGEGEWEKEGEGEGGRDGEGEMGGGNLRHGLRGMDAPGRHVTLMAGPHSNVQLSQRLLTNVLRLPGRRFFSSIIFLRRRRRRLLQKIFYSP